MSISKVTPFLALLLLTGALVVEAQSANPNAATAPTIRTQPASITVKKSATATFVVGAAGTAPLSYQWYKWNLTSPISGATAYKYIAPATTDSDNGAAFYVKVSNSAGSVVSNAAYLTVVDPPVITESPSSVTVTLPAFVFFSVGATGTWPMTYQWYKNGSAIPGANGATYPSPPLKTTDNGDTFYAVVKNAYGSATSKVATLTVKPFAGTGTYPIVGEWSGTATINNPDGTKQTTQVVAAFSQTSYALTATVIFIDDEGVPTMTGGLASLNNLNLFTAATEDTIDIGGVFSSNLLTLTGSAAAVDASGGNGQIVLSSDHNTLTGTSALLDGTTMSWRLTRTK